MKYIDADLLREKIVREVEQWKEKTANHYTIEAEARWSEANYILGILDSLQQEQQDVDLEKEIEEYWIATGWSKIITLGKFKVIARYFYGLGQLNSK